MLAGYAHLIAAARRLQWDAEEIDLRGDATVVARLDDAERFRLIRLVAGFCLAETAVAAELTPYVASATPNSPQRACFAIQQRDELRHARFFQRVAAEVLHADPGQLAAAADPPLQRLFGHELPAVARALAADDERIDEAIGLYHLVIEGIVFAVGQEALLELAGRGGLTGIADGVGRVQGDERWHVGLGVLHLQRLGRRVDVGTHAARAAAAWGPAIATDERLTRVLAAHARRLMIAQEATARVSGR